MQHALVKHPGCPRSPIDHFAVEAFRFEDGRVKFAFAVFGGIDKLRVPAEKAPERADELWRHTCFEAFVAPQSGTQYIELNFAPSRAWAAYRFDGYRSGMSSINLDPPELERNALGPILMLSASVALGPVPELAPWENWRVGLSAILEAEDGTLSYWALAHPPGKPDFHHPDCFAAELAPDASL